MIVENLKLKNFLSHAQTDIYFEKGVNIIIGNNGAGKSSIVDGMKYALFGEKRGKSIQDLIKKGTRELEVSLSFRNNSHNYEIRRILN
ncbi:MAG: AAA family ATPase, partial [Thermoplasmata archaeon]